MKNSKEGYTQVRCPECGYKMPIFFDEKAHSEGLRVACKGRNCKHIFEVKIKGGQQIR